MKHHCAVRGCKLSCLEWSVLCTFHQHIYSAFAIVFGRDFKTYTEAVYFWLERCGW